MSSTSDVVTEEVPRLRLGAFRLTPTQIRRVRKLPMILVGLVITLAVVWVLFLADRSWTADTSAGAAIDEPGQFVVTLLDGLTFAGLLFVVASGFTLIFGLMRTVNMAHGAFFLLAAYIAIDLQQTMVGKTRNIEPGDVSMLAVGRSAPGRSARGRRVGCGDPAAVPALEPGPGSPPSHHHDRGDGHSRRSDAVPVRRSREDDGVARRRRALHQHLRSALRDRAGCSCSPSRWSSGSCCGCGSTGPGWAWSSVPASTTRTMVRALGINVAVVFGITFFVGAFLAGMGGSMGASFAGVALGHRRAVAPELPDRGDHRGSRLGQGCGCRVAALRHGHGLLARLSARPTTRSIRSSSPS